MSPTLYAYRHFTPLLYRPRLRLSPAWRAWKPGQPVPPKWECFGRGISKTSDHVERAYRAWASAVDGQLAQAQDAAKQRLMAAMQNSRDPWIYGGQYIGFGWQQ